MAPRTEPDRSVRLDVQQIVEKAQGRLGDLQVSPLGQQLLRGVLMMLKRSVDYDELEQKLQALIRDLDTGRTALRQTLDDAMSAETAWIEQEHFGEVWWKRRQREVETAFEAGPQTLRSRWLAIYAEAVIAERFDVCLQMTLNDWQTPDGVEALRTGAAALTERRYRDAVESLGLLAEEVKRPTGGASRADLLVFLGRIYLYELSNVAAARRYVERARDLEPGEGRPAAALGECLRASGELDQASEQFARAIQLSAHLPDGYIGAALVCEDQKSWHRALDFYGEAIEAAGGAAPFGQLLAPAPAGLYWQRARRRKNSDLTQALADIDRALDLGVRWSGTHPDRRALRDKAEILEALGRVKEAADAYFQAGRRYSWGGKVSTARPLLEKACALDPGHALARWQLSDVLRVLSYSKRAPFVDDELVEQSKAHWDAGLALRHPDAGTAWVYLSRALLNEQRWPRTKNPDLWWESLLFTECAVLLSRDYATGWAYLGQYQRLLVNLHAALEATERALTINPRDLAALEARSMVLTMAARYTEAEELIDQRLARAEEWGLISLKAYVQLHTGRPEQALELASRAAEAVPDAEPYRALRAVCLRRLGRLEESEQDVRWIWDHRDAPEGARWQPQDLAWAAYLLGYYDEAASLLQTAIEQDTFFPMIQWGGLGQVLLARGDPARDDITEGERALEHCVAMARHPGHLEDTLSFDLDILEDILTTRPGPEPAQAALERVRALVARTKQDLARSVPTPQAELRAIVAAAPEGSVRWLAAQAGLARLAAGAALWQEALDSYLLLEPFSAFPEAGTGLARALGHLAKEADHLVESDQVGTAREHYERLLGLAREHLGPAANVTVDLALRAGFAALAQSDHEAVHRYLGEAVSGTGVQDRLNEFAAVEQLFVRSPAQYWRLVDGLRRLQDEFAARAQERAVLDALIERLDLSKVYRLAAAAVATFPVATPLVLKLGPGLMATSPVDEARLDQEIERLLARMETATGVSVPGVRVLKADGPGDYVILIDDTPVAAGTVPVDRPFVLADTPGQPLTGRPESPRGFVLRLLEAVIRCGLPCFIRSDDVPAWLDRPPASPAGLSQEGAPGPDSDLARVVLPDRSARVLLSRVLQVLAAEGVPLTTPGVVLRAMRDAPADASVLELVAAVRRKLGPALPGNAPDVPRAMVPEPVEAALAAGLHRENGAMVWQLPRAETAGLVGRLRAVVPEGTGGFQTAALVVRSSELRPFVWRLLSAELPHLSVLAEEELAGKESAAEETR